MCEKYLDKKGVYEMKCPKCGNEDFAYVQTTGVVLRKKLPIKISIILFVLAFFFFSQINSDLNLTWRHVSTYLFVITLVSGIIYTEIRKKRINDDRRRVVTKKICKDCEHVEYID